MNMQANMPKKPVSATVIAAWITAGASILAAFIVAWPTLKADSNKNQNKSSTSEEVDTKSQSSQNEQASGSTSKIQITNPSSSQEMPGISANNNDGASISFAKSITELKIKTELLKGAVYLDNGDPEQASKVYEEIRGKYPTSAEANCGAALAYQKLGRTDTAIQRFNEAISLDPKKYEAWFGLGELYFDVNRFDDAKKAYQKATSCDSSQFSPLFKLGCIAIHENDLPGAIVFFNRANQLTPHSSSYFNLEFLTKRVIKTTEAD